MRHKSRILLYCALYLLVLSGSANLAPGAHRELVPRDKGLTDSKVEALLRRGKPPVFKGSDLKTIGMPVGGIGAGQLYLRGDGTLAKWWIFNKHHRTWAAPGYTTFRPQSPVESGFAVVVGKAGNRRARRLNREEFPQVTFRGEYPVATVRYPAENFPMSTVMEVFSSFIPLNTRDSALPATIFHITLKNHSSRPVRASPVGWLQNAVCFHSADAIDARRESRILRIEQGWCAHHSIAEGGGDMPEPRRILFEDFEGDDYGNWTVTGRAFGDGPVHGTMLHQQKVSGYKGQGLVNSFRGDLAEKTAGGDDFKGTLTSPPFTVQRRFINFLIGGGNHSGSTCIQLVVNDEVVRSTAGENEEKLTWAYWNVADLQNKEARIRIIDRHTGGWGHINIDHIEFANVPRNGSRKPLDELPGYGTMALAMAGNRASQALSETLIDAVETKKLKLHAAKNISYPARKSRSMALAAEPVVLEPGGESTFTYVLAWYFPNHPHGRHYASWFESARDVAGYVLEEHDRLAANTRLWRDTYYRESTLPWWLLFRLHAPVANLATNTCQWRKNGRFWCWEGVGCCRGTCTHVWNYAQAHGRLFPSLARSIRNMQDFTAVTEGGGFNPDTGLVGFRSNRAYAADGQCSTVLKAYREHLMSADSTFLKENWPRVKKALQYMIKQNGNDDGLIERRQHTTFDCAFWGVNTFVGSLYLAALRAGEEMAADMGEEKFADRCRRIFRSGRKLTVRRLWDGEYFVQDVNLKKHPKHQYGHGCLSDQTFGQTWAHRLGLGYIYPKDKVKKALSAVWKYNWTTDVGPYTEVHPPHPRRKILARPGEPGLLVCTWPKTAYMAQGMNHKNQEWTGIEYQVAAGMAWEGMVTRALAVCRGVNARYDPEKHNPYNEVECGEHYARSLASWGVFTALCGYRCNGPEGHMAFAPRMKKDNFRAAFTAAGGWGLFSQQRGDGTQDCRIEVRWGHFELKSLSLAVPDGIDSPHVSVRLDGDALQPETASHGDTVRIELERRTTIRADQTLQVNMR